MGRIRGKSFWTRKREDYKSRDVGQEQFDKNMKNVGSILKLGTQLYTNPMIRDAVGGLEDLFQGSPEEKKDVVTTAAESEVSNLKKAALARIQDEELDKTAPVQMPTADAKGQQELEALKGQAADARVKSATDVDRMKKAVADPMKAEALEAQYGMLGEVQDDIQIDAGTFKNYIKDLSGGRSLAQIEQERDSHLQSHKDEIDLAKQAEREAYFAYHEDGDQEMAKRKRESAARYYAMAEESKRDADAAQGVINNINQARDQLAATGKADAAYVQKQEALLGEPQELRKTQIESETKSLAKAQQLSAMASKKAAELNQSTEEAIASAVNKILGGGTLSDEEQVKFDNIKSKLIVDEETGDIMLNVTTEERVAISNDPEMSVYLAAATKQLERDIQQTSAMESTQMLSGDIDLAMQTLEEAAGPTDTVEEVTTTTTTPAGMPSLISDEEFVTSTDEEKNEFINKIQTRVATRYVDGSPQINAVLNQIRAQVGAGGMGNTPAEVEANMERIAEAAAAAGAVGQEGGMEVPSIAGKSLQEAQMVAMEIGQNPNISFKAKQAAMRELLKQVSSIEDVTSDWASNYGTAGYVGTSAAANSLMNAFSGQIPKAPKTASEYQRFTMGQKKASAPGKLEKTRLQNIKLAEEIAQKFAAAPVDLDNKLLKNMIAALKLDQFKTRSGSGGGGPSSKKLDQFRREILSGSNSSYKWLQSQSTKLDDIAGKINDITIEDAISLNDNQIAAKYGARLDTYLQDVRNAGTDAKKRVALNKAKAQIRKDFVAKSKKYKAIAKKINPMLEQLRALGISDETRAKREVLLRKLNRLLQELQGEI